jgi:hypothetical protein
MKRKIIYFWEEEPGVHSWARLQGFLTLLYTFYITHIQLMNDNISIELISLYLVASVAPKTIQKFAEKKKNSTV